MGALTYTRDDDRYYRRELQALKDNIEDTNALLSEMLWRLRNADDRRTYAAREVIATGQKTLHTAAACVALARQRLPEPVTA